jgi:hypothetical protein
MAVRVSALRTGCAPLPRNIIFLFVVLISVRGSVNPRAIVRQEGLGKLKTKINCTHRAKFRLLHVLRYWLSYESYVTFLSRQCTFRATKVEVEVPLRLTVGQSVSQYVLVSSTLVGLATRYYLLSEYCCLNFAVSFLWGALSDERTGLQFAV